MKKICVIFFLFVVSLPACAMKVINPFEWDTPLKVEVMDFVVVERVARVFARLVRSADIDRFCTAQLAVDVIVGRCAGKHVYFEFPSGLVLFFCLLSQSHWDSLRCSTSREPREAHIGTIKHEIGSFFCCYDWIPHIE